MVWHAVDCGGGDVYEAPGTGSERLFEDDARTLHVGGKYLFWGVKRQGGGGVDDDICALDDSFDAIPVADIALEETDAIALGVIEIHQVDAGDVRVAFIQQVAHQVDAEEAADAGDEDIHGGEFIILLRL